MSVFVISNKTKDVTVLGIVTTERGVNFKKETNLLNGLSKTETVRSVKEGVSEEGVIFRVYFFLEKKVLNCRKVTSVSL